MDMEQLMHEMDTVNVWHDTHDMEIDVFHDTLTVKICMDLMPLTIH
jgi:hypothetical protein